MVGVPADMPIVGYLGQTVNWLRLFTARASEDFDIEIFNRGDYVRAIEQKIQSENISRVLYPSDSVVSGKELRLVQEYFLVACAIGDIMRRFRKQHGDKFELFPSKVAIQMNDTHPSLSVAELMRSLMDDHGLAYEQAWEITQQTLAYTNHTLLPEALEKWSVPLLEKVLPRHMQIIFNINHRFMRDMQQYSFMDTEKLQRMSIIEEGYEKQVRMANLCIVGSHSVNGVSALHTELIKKSLVPDFYEVWPEKFNNKTNGVAPRRWLMEANPGLTELISLTLDENKWITSLDKLRDLEQWAEDPEFRAAFKEVKRQNKLKLQAVIQEQTGVLVDPDSIFDVHIKRIHEYKRQLLNVMHIVSDYLRIVEHGELPAVPRTYIFAGKAAPGYWAAKQIIKLIHNVADVVNNDSKAKEWIKVTFLPDYRVSLAELIMPAADCQRADFDRRHGGLGHRQHEAVHERRPDHRHLGRRQHRDRPGSRRRQHLHLRAARRADRRDEGERHLRPARSLRRGSAGERGARRHQFRSFLRQASMACSAGSSTSWFDRGDKYFHIADFLSYVETHRLIEQEYLADDIWWRKAVLNVARIGKFSSDRTVQEYARDIWHIGQYEKSWRPAKPSVRPAASAPVTKSNGEDVSAPEAVPDAPASRAIVKP